MLWAFMLGILRYDSWSYNKNKIRFCMQIPNINPDVP